jgi:hypothetical protein
VSVVLSFQYLAILISDVCSRDSTLIEVEMLKVVKC